MSVLGEHVIAHRFDANFKVEILEIVFCDMSNHSALAKLQLQAWISMDQLGFLYHIS